MALGQNEQFFYSPDARIFINSLTKGGIIEVSDDFMSLTIERNINAVSTVSLYLANNGFKYTPASRNFSAFNHDPPVINTMDQIIIFLKKENYYQYFTGFVTYAPVVTLIPEPIVISASCTLYKAQNSYWDAGAIEYEGIIPGILQNSQIFGGKVQSNDGGVATGIINLLTKVANWNKNDIHIGGIPTQWVNFATEIYKQTQIQLKDKNATSFRDIINFLQVTGGGGGSVTYTTTAGKTGKSGSDGTVSSLGVPGAPEGTAILNITSGTPVTASFSTTSKLNVNPGADKIIKDNKGAQYWVGVPFSYWNDPHLNHHKTKAKEWISGSMGPEKYPSNAQVGRLLLISNPTTGKSVQAHVIFAIKENLIDGADIVLSEAAFSFLGGDTSKSQDILKGISVDAWLTEKATNLKGGAVPPTSLANVTSSYSLSTLAAKQHDPNNGGGKNSISGLYAMTWPDVLATGIVPHTNGPWTSAVWSICLLLLLGAPVTQNNIVYIGNWISKENGMGKLFPDGSGGDWLCNNNPLNATLNSNAPNPNAHYGYLDSAFNWYPTAQDGLEQTSNMIKQQNMSTILRALSQHNGISSSNFFIALTKSAWTGGPPAYVGDSDFITNGYPTDTICYENTVQSPAHLPGGTIPASSTTIAGTGGMPSTSVPGLNNSTGNYNFNTTQGVVGYDANSTILAGTPRAFITDVPALSTINTLATMGLREFQSGPDGSFLAWYPDYFGLYGTAPALSIHDIEIIDFSLYHDDTQLYTHVGVSGDPTEIGNVSLVDWIMTNGIITIENNAILGLLFGSDPATISSSMNSLLAQGIDINIFAKQFLKRYGMRPYVDSEPMIRSELMEFMYALQEFLYLWSQQYATNVTFTFMPELYPGMLIEIADHGIQVYVQSVAQSCSRDGGFTTNAVVTSPTRIIGKKVINGKTVNNVVPIDFGYPIKLQNA